MVGKESSPSQEMHGRRLRDIPTVPTMLGTCPQFEKCGKCGKAAKSVGNQTWQQDIMDI